MSKLTATQVLEIRKQYAGGATVRALGKRYGVDPSTAHRAAIGATKKFVVDENSRYRAHNLDHGCQPYGTYMVWKGMRSRCNNEAGKSWSNYGGRGIKVCERWNDFKNFLSDMGEKPAGKSLERNNNDGDYSPENCSWATPKEQAANRRRRRIPPARDPITRRFASSRFSKCLALALGLDSSESVELIRTLLIHVPALRTSFVAL